MSNKTEGTRAAYLSTQLETIKDNHQTELRRGLTWIEEFSKRNNIELSSQQESNSHIVNIVNSENSSKNINKP